MPNVTIKPIKRIRGVISLPGDKSISHRALMLGAIAKGTTLIENLSFGEDCLRTIDAFRKMGIKITSSSFNHHHLPLTTICGRGLYGLKTPKKPLYLGNSGTTMRLILGILAGQNFKCTLTAGESLSRRPMRRVIEPLRMMGTKIETLPVRQAGRNQKPVLRLRSGLALSKVKVEVPETRSREEYPPIIIRGGRLKAISFRLPIPSAQVKSAILLAGLYAQGITSIIEPIKSRDHTERMLKLFGASLKVEGLKCKLEGPQVALYSPGKIKIPGDISSCAFFLVAAAVSPESHLVIKSVGLNPTRTGIIDVLKKMGADINIRVKGSSLPAGRQGSRVKSYEPLGDIIVRGSRLRGVTIEGNQIPRLIDELPILMVAASLAKGETCIKETGELRVKETDRINSMFTNLRKMGADIKVEGRRSKVEGRRMRNKEDIIIIRGRERLRGARVNSFADHRTAMSMIIAALFAEGRTIVEGVGCIDKSFPEFMEVLKSVTK